MRTAIDDVDRQLLQALQQDCKTSLSRLGETVGLSAPAVMERVRKLEAAGIVSGYHARLDSTELGLDITAFIGVSINYPKDIEGFLAQLAQHSQVQECHHVTGGHTLLLKIKTRNTASLERVISRLRAVEGVTRTETMVVLSTAKESSAVAFEEIEITPQAPRKRRRAGGS